MEVNHMLKDSSRQRHDEPAANSGASQSKMGRRK